jgi:hypothetical protein
MIQRDFCNTVVKKGKQHCLIIGVDLQTFSPIRFAEIGQGCNPKICTETPRKE